MIKFLIAVDGSAPSDRAVSHLIHLIRDQETAEVHLLNVRRPIEAWEVRRFLTDEEITETQQSEGENDLRSARALLDEAKQPYTAHILVGEVAPTIARLAAELGCDAILMGTHGRGELANLLMGSVATEVIHLVDLPVTLVK